MADRPHPTAYVVGFIDTTDGTLKGFGVFSETSPTVGARLMPFTLLTGYGVDFSDGLKSLRAQIEDERSRWLHRYLHDNDWASLGMRRPGGKR